MVSEEMRALYAQFKAGGVPARSCTSEDLARAAFEAGDEFDSIDRHEYGRLVTLGVTISLWQFKGQHFDYKRGVFVYNKKLIDERPACV